MNRNVDILNEIKEISPLIAGISHENVFTVPPGYFDTVSDTVMAGLRESMAIQVIENGAVPEGYFDDLPGHILAKIKGTAGNELQEISPLLAGIKKINPFNVPVNYFELLPADVVASLEEKVPAVLQHARNIHAFEVPEGYFENLSAEILHKVHQHSGTKVITLPKRRNLILQYAAAAIFTGAIVLGVYKFTNTSVINTDDIVPTATTIEPSIEKGIAIAADDKKFDETLGSLDQNDIAQYLEKNGSESDMALLTSGLEEDNLPDQEEYFTDEKTLDNFIETISSKN